MLRLRLPVDLVHHERRVALDDDMRSPWSSARRRPSISAWYSAMLWVPSSKHLTAWTKEPSLNSTMHAAVTGPGLCPPPSKWMVANSSPREQFPRGFLR